MIKSRWDFSVHSPNGRKSFSLELPRNPEGLPQDWSVICPYPERVASMLISPTSNRAAGAAFHLFGRPPNCEEFHK